MIKTASITKIDAASFMVYLKKKFKNFKLSLKMFLVVVKILLELQTLLL